jgi:hypothetical protein
MKNYPQDTDVLFVYVERTDARFCSLEPKYSDWREMLKNIVYLVLVTVRECELTGIPGAVRAMADSGVFLGLSTIFEPIHPKVPRCRFML